MNSYGETLTEWRRARRIREEREGTHQVSSRPKNQDQDEPDTPPRNQTRTLGWTGYSPTVRELRGWLDKIPDQATIELRTIVATNSYRITATWEIP